MSAATTPTEDDAEPANLTDSTWAPPISERRITTPFGIPGEMWQWKGYHTGDDYAAPVGAPITSAGAGRVVSAGDLGSAYGYGVVVRHDNRITTLYAHMSAVSVGVGDVVDVGAPIGRVGATGNVTGPHLHFEVRMDDEPIRPFAGTRGWRTVTRRGAGYRPMMLN